MDHESLEENQLPDRYLMGKLSAEERLRFEEHYLDCAICLDQLESLEGLRTGLRELSPQGSTAQAERRAPVLAFFRGPRSLAMLAAACLALAVLPSLLVVGKLRRTRDELASTRRTVDEERRERSALARALDVERAAAANGAASLAAAVFTLNLTRGAGTEGPHDRIVLPDARDWVILLLDRPASPRFESYQVRISSADGRPIGDARNASVTSDDMLAVGFPPGFLTESDYVLSLEGLGAGPARDLARYRFRAALRK
jgi:hypothetical protein